ncbi:hypothetical protein Bbelb_074210 [Branchiostoma belcheri]|nr:hypothetical protein Bbelb_074210 [Branchiostoma belcheri]
MVSVGGKNKKFEPKLDELKTVEYLDDKAVDVIGRISRSKLGTLEQELDILPTEFLKELKRRLKQCHCGEDNVLTLLLQKYLETVKVFGTSPVEFVALDGDSPGGKPFCEVCDRKVRFYSVLPTFLQELGVSGNDQEFLSHLKTLFAKMVENP